MSDFSIAKHFNQYFKIHFASTKELRQEAFRIRYAVYSAELGWEPKNNQQMETDECDDYAYHCLLEHRRTGNFAGCIRLIIPPTDTPDKALPFEANCLASARKEILDTTALARGSFGEISRLAVLSSFRRRPHEKDVPFVLNNVNSQTVYTEEERRNFPNIAMGLYLSGIALASLCNHAGMVVMMEPRLNRRLKRLGLPFQQIGDDMDYHGRRAMFYLDKNDFKRELNEQLKELYDIIKKDMAEQIELKPYNDAPFKIPSTDVTDR
ncbi:N-acyl amino acid synthase, PEP-CTERM/exosortase system-associated [Colwellia chukchiensis]|uniref:N-acyl amino acid synthase, PEP-CTERM/exosortase system-associated n=1 Tax=Colwellia chukchiensis TaxID=641665 RepID=A0A1H7T5K2_9GAMM|nr:PEP-CTERM/exosortase system-associated acyltransferase [Colwellia chukchiensis]SEL80170.1 N-acyl amino acid synthase, PEP-CTERM/exosortase system-associated [Colwellia chukchiensis]